jgi:purine-nucleoside phosphorylase
MGAGESQPTRRVSRSPDLYVRIQRAAGFLRGRLPLASEVGIVLGSGLGQVGERVTDAVSVPYVAIPHFPAATVAGHAGRFLAGRLAGTSVAILQGRFHHYEGYALNEVTFPIRVLAALGITTLVVTNAAGGLDPRFRTGDLMLIRDILNLTGANPLFGPNDERLGPRFPGMRDLFSAELMRRARAAARREGFALRTGVYAGLSGPNYETAAEIRMLRKLGADAVGMSTVPEVIVARHAGIPEILGISCITNVESGRRTTPPSHAAVLRVAAQAGNHLAALLAALLARRSPPASKVP